MLNVGVDEKHFKLISYFNASVTQLLLLVATITSWSVIKFRLSLAAV